MSGTIRGFNAPAAPLNPETLQEAVERFDAQFDVLTLLDIDGFVLGVVEDGLGANADSSKSQALRHGEYRVVRQAASLEGEGFLEVTRICDGWGPAPVADAANGTMQLIIPFTDNGVDPTIWGEFSSCKYKSNDQEILLQPGGRAKVGDVRIFVGDGLTVNNFGGSPFIFEVDLRHAVGDEGFLEDTVIQFRLQLDGTIELLLPVEGGELVASFVEGALGFRASNGDWVCNLEGATCDDGNGTSFSF